jgi:hypothetical protein
MKHTFLKESLIQKVKSENLLSGRQSVMGGFLHIIFYSLQDKTDSTKAKMGKQPKAIIGGHLI